MTRTIIYIILFSVCLTSCLGKENNETKTRKMKANEFQKLISDIKSSDIYENPLNWEARGLNTSDEAIILILRKASNNFLDKLAVIYNSNESKSIKFKQISKIVDELPWEELDTEEKEFMADVLAPAIEALGYDPWSIF